MQLTPEQRDAVIRTLYGEAATDPESQLPVAHVIKNRVTQSGADPVKVVKSPYQFEPWQSRRGELEALPTDSPIYQGLGKVVDQAWASETDPTGGATLFYAPTAQAAKKRPPPAWDTGAGTDIGQHRFFKGNFPTPRDAEPIVTGLGKPVPAPAGNAAASPPVSSVEAPASSKTKSRGVPNLSALFAEDPEGTKLLIEHLAASGIDPAHIAAITGAR